MTFKAGDKVYNYRFGIVELFEGDHQVYPLKVLGRSSHTRYHFDGKITSTDKHPSLIPLEKAEKMGLVRKRVKPHKGLRVKYYDKSTDTYCIDHGLYYRSEEEFEYEYPEFLFVSFVDDKLNECPPPQETIEWEEI
jgi:hypothetical protein